MVTRVRVVQWERSGCGSTNVAQQTKGACCRWEGGVQKVRESAHLLYSWANDVPAVADTRIGQWQGENPAKA